MVTRRTAKKAAEKPKDTAPETAGDAASPPLETPTPSDRRLVQEPDGTATPAEANERRVETPAPEHVESENKPDTVPPFPRAVEALKGHNDDRAKAGEAVEPVGPGNAAGITGRAAPEGDAPDIEPGTFLHPQTKEGVEATKRYSVPQAGDTEQAVYVTTPDGEKVHKGLSRWRNNSDGSLDILDGDRDPGAVGRVVKSYRSGQFSYVGHNPQP
jgi:hypothetical protein